MKALFSQNTDSKTKIDVNKKEVQGKEIEAMQTLSKQGLMYKIITEQTRRSKSTIITYTKYSGKEQFLVFADVL